MTWKLAPSLGVLRQQLDEAAPKRSKKSDGTIGDAAHAARKSDHNPDALGIVHAIDLTHDPANGADMGLISERLRISKDRRIKYVIWNRRFYSPKTNWQWEPYKGPSPHDKHMHVSVAADGLEKWPIEVGGDTVTINPGEKGNYVRVYQQALNAWAVKQAVPNWVVLVEDGDYGAGTEAAVNLYQRASQIEKKVPRLGALDDLTRDLLERFVES